MKIFNQVFKTIFRKFIKKSVTIKTIKTMVKIDDLLN